VIPVDSSTSGSDSKQGGPDPPTGPAVSKVEWVNFMEGRDLRGLVCRTDWSAEAKRDPKATLCRDPASQQDCPAYVDPTFLTTADGMRQWTCTQTEEYTCSVSCSGAEATPAWSANACPSKGQCPTAKELAERASLSEGGLGLRGGGEHAHRQGLPVSAGLKDEVMVDLRGLECELKEGKEVCFREGSSGDREVCPDFVTSAYLTGGGGQHLCLPGATDKYYCTVTCQEGNDQVRWGANEIKWCDANPGSCPPRPTLTPQSQFKLKAWSMKPRQEKQCEKRTPGANPVADVTLGILTHSSQELRTFKDTMQSYESAGLLKAAPDIIIFVNKRGPDIDTFLKPFVQRHAPRLRVLGNKLNHGITHALDWMVGNSTQQHTLLLEKDFQLIEPLSCVEEQLSAGVKLIKEGTAHVVRYRSRDRPGRPNWAEIMFKGNEEKVFQQQPNLFCNHYYWIAEPEKRWPDKIWKCLEEQSIFYCSKAFYCNWTNNPTLMANAWWKQEYIEKRFKGSHRHDPYEHLEMYMNWEPGSWNDEPWIVAQGDGLFKHVDRNNFA
jgi:hypothetical protein